MATENKDKETVKSEPEFTGSQKAVIGAKVNNILVSAAAGSGKTTVLVERIIRKLIDEEKSVDSFLVATFTKAAASNMKQKIAKEIKKALEKETRTDVRSHLKRQLDLLPNAYIQTLNAFCSRVIKEKGFEIAGEESSIDPAMTIIGDQELKILLNRAAQEAIDSKYLDILSEGMDERFNMAINYLTDGRSDSNLTDLLVSMYPRFRSMPNYINAINEAFEIRVNKDNNNQVIFLKEFNDKLLKLYEEANKSAKRSLLLVDSTIFVKDKNKDSECRNVFTNAINTTINETNSILDLSKTDISSEDLFVAIQESLKVIGDIGAIECRGRDESVKVLMNSMLAMAALLKVAGGSIWGTGDLLIAYELDSKYASFIKMSLEDLIKCQKEKTVVIDVFRDLLIRMDTNYTNLKSRFHAMDFSDQEQFAHRILSNAEVADYYREKFDEIYVDEYQDNSRLQDSIISLFSKNNVFMVGDVKQSIYKFRYADPTMFTEKMNAYKNDSTKGDLYPLNNNFRSTPEILNFVNVIFEQLMGDRNEIYYDDDHKLVPPDNATYGNSLPRVVLVRTDKSTEEDSESNDEVVEESGVNAGVKVDFKGVLKEVQRYMAMDGVELKDILILTRKTKASRQIAQLLNTCGYKAICNEAKTIYDDPDIATLCALLTLLGNEHRDECLIGVLLASYRFSNFTVDEIAKITLYAKKKHILRMNLIVKLREYSKAIDSEVDVELKARVNMFLDTFDNLKSDSSILNIGELIEKIYYESGIKATLRDSKEGVAKFVVFKDWLCTNYLSSNSDISSIANSLDELKLKLGSNATIDYESTDSNAINCMTYHKSKGLERKCVIVTDFTSKENDDASDMVVFDSKLGFLCNDYRDDELVTDKSFERIMYEDVTDFSDWSETIRLFYVALTRAEKNLSVVTSLSVPKNAKKKFEKIYRLIVPQESQKFDREFILRQSNRNHLFLYSLLRLSGAKELYDEVVTYADIKVPLDDNMYRDSFKDFDLEIIDYNDISVVPKELDDVVNQNIPSAINVDSNGNALIEKYEFENSVKAPSKTTVSLLKKEEQKLLYDKEIDQKECKNSIPLNLEVPDLDYFTNESDYSTSASKGTLIHNLLRFTDYGLMRKKISEGKEISVVLDEEIEELKQLGVIKDSMIPVIESFRPNLISLISSDVFSRIASAEDKGDALFEKPIMFSTEINGTNDYTIVQGILDVLFYENGEAVIVDYKTDRIDENDINEIRNIVIERHKLQLDLYASALEVSGIKVKEKIIWLIRKGIAISL